MSQQLYMSQQLSLKQYYGSQQNPSVVDQTKLPLLGEDQSTEVNPQQYPIRIYDAQTNYSYERWFRIQVVDMGGSIQVQNFKVWQSTNTPSNGCTLYYGTSQNYRTPVGGLGNPSPDQVNPIPTSEPQTQNLTINGETDPQNGQYLSQQGDMTDFGILQLRVEPTQTQGGSQVITVSYDEIS